MRRGNAPVTLQIGNISFLFELEREAAVKMFVSGALKFACLELLLNISLYFAESKHV